MACRFLRPGRPCSCALVTGDVVPSMHERERHCYPDHVADCRVLRAALEAGRPIDESEYYVLWLAPDPHETRDAP